MTLGLDATSLPPAAGGEALCSLQCPSTRVLLKTPGFQAGKPVARSEAVETYWCARLQRLSPSDIEGETEFGYCVNRDKGDTTECQRERWVGVARIPSTVKHQNGDGQTPDEAKPTRLDDRQHVWCAERETLSTPTN